LIEFDGATLGWRVVPVNVKNASWASGERARCDESEKIATNAGIR